jgi:DNA polymerase bacteriophage-type
VVDNYDALLDDIRSGRGVQGSPMEVIPSLLRGAFRAGPGKQFVAADLSQIELRVLAWLTGCAPMLKTFADNRDLYIDFAAKMYGVEYDDVTKLQRQMAKPAVLSCGYGSGGGNLEYDGSGDEVKTGLWGYADRMGIEMSREQAWDAVNKYRAEYAEVPRFWDAVMSVITGLMREGDESGEVCGVWFERLYYRYFPGKMLRVMLPSGRWLTYLKPRLEQSGWQQNVTFDAKLGGNIFRRRLYGSLHFENLVQAIARDVIAVGMVRATDAGLSLVGSAHDELISLELLTALDSLARLIKAMTDPIAWCDDLPLKADGWVGKVYRK